jgi:hypothetical protein
VVNKVTERRVSEVEIMNTRIALALLSRAPRLLLLGLAILVVSFVAAAGIGQSDARAEDAPQFTKMSIAVMPEYDQRSVLVSYRGDLGPDVSLPLESSFLLPADADISQVCSIKQPEEEHICQLYSADPAGEYLALKWETITPTMYVEFYYDSVSGAGQRDLDFTFMPPYPVDDLELYVLEPGDAANFSLLPAPDDVVEDQGSRHHMYTYEDVPADEPVSIVMTYSRDTDEPAAPPRAAAAAPEGESAISGNLVLILGLAGVGVLAFAVGSVVVRRFRAAAVVAGQVSPAAATAQRGGFFCRHCGAGAVAGSAFCAACGQEVSPPSGWQG